MSIFTADVHKLIVAVWNANDIDSKFLAYRPANTDFPVLHDGEATPGNDFPYCVFESTPPNTITRTTGNEEYSYMINRVPVNFNVHTKGANGKSAKKIASELVEELLAVFGGHPTRNPPELPALDHGCALIAQYMSDLPIRTGDDEYRWNLEYVFLTDIPVRVA